MREPWLRLTVMVHPDNERKFVVVDVGDRELATLVSLYGSVDIIGWGRYGEGCYAYQSEEHERIQETMKRVKKNDSK